MSCRSAVYIINFVKLSDFLKQKKKSSSNFLWTTFVLILWNLLKKTSVMSKFDVPIANFRVLDNFSYEDDPLTFSLYKNWKKTGEWLFKFLSVTIQRLKMYGVFSFFCLCLFWPKPHWISLNNFLYNSTIFWKLFRALNEKK